MGEGPGPESKIGARQEGWTEQLREEGVPKLEIAPSIPVELRAEALEPRYQNRTKEMNHDAEAPN